MSVPLVVAAVGVALLAVALSVACLRQPMRVALPLYAALIPFGERLSLGGSPFASLGSLVGVLLGLGLLLQLALGRRTAPRLSPSIPIWLLFLATAAATTLWTLDLAATLSGVAVLASLIVVYVLVALSPADRQVLRRTENGLLAGGVAVVCYGLVQLFVLGGFPNTKTGVPVASVSGRFGNDLLGPDIESITLLLPFLIALNRAFTERKGRAWHGLVAALMLLGILMTGSRAGTLAAAVVVLVLAWTAPRQVRRGLLVTFVVGGILGAVIWVFHPAGIAERTYASATSSSGRTDIWKVGAAACTKYCGPGAGWGTFPDVYAATQATVPGARVLVGPQGSYQAHNLWLLIGVELGAVGLVLFVTGLVVAAAEAARIPRTLRGPPLAALVGLCVGVFFLSSMEFKFFWMVMIIIAINRNVAETEEQQSPGPAAGSVVGGQAAMPVGVPLR